MKFYDILASLYDNMIGFDQHLEGDIDIYRKMLKRYPAEKILDAGCGTGLHSLIFSMLGAEVTGIDSSPAMINRAKENAARHALDVHYYKSDFKNFPDQVRGPFDAIYCLGNSFVHLKGKKERLLVMKNFQKVLKPEGLLCIQLLNYEKILNEKPVIISQKLNGSYRFIRQYEYRRNKIIFTLEIRSETENKQLVQDIFPVKSHELISLEKASGFNRIELTGSLAFDPFDPATSANMCVWLRKVPATGEKSVVVK